MSNEKLPLLGFTAGKSASPPSTRGRGRGVYLIISFIAVSLILRIFLLCSYWVYRHPGGHIDEDPYLLRARRVLTRHPLIDGHDDLLIAIRSIYNNNINNSTFQELFENGEMPLHVDAPRIEKGHLGGAFWSAFVPCQANTSDYSDKAYAPVVRATLDQLDLFNRLSKLYPKYFTPSASEADAQAAFLAGRLISPVAIEGLHQIGNSAGTLRLYHQLGVRYATLTWNCHNVFADAALTYENREISVAKPLWHGVSKRGRALIHEMNRLGMLVDLSHVSTDTMRDVLYGNRDLDAEPSWEGSFAPPIFSHSSAYAICPHPRNVPDDVLKLVRNRGGLVMVNISPDFISCRTDPKSKNGLPLFVNETNTLDHMVDHIMHIGELIGYDWVGIGTDFDGIESTPRGLEGVERFPQLVAQMLRRGVSEQDAAKVVGRNLLRVWAKADQVSRDMKAKGWEPLEDELSRGWWEEGQAI